MGELIEITQKEGHPWGFYKSLLRREDDPLRVCESIRRRDMLTGDHNWEV